MDGKDARFENFAGIVTSNDEITSIIGDPMPQALAKEIDHLDDICRKFIAASPFCVIASSNPERHIDLSPKGDPAGFVRVLDDKHLAVPDRPGNRRVDTFHNLLKDPRIGIIFMIPGKGETLRVAGEARIVRDERLRETMAVNRRVPALALVVYVERVFLHCPKAILRSKLWQPDAWPDSRGTASIGQAMIAHGKLGVTEEELEKEARKAGVLALY